MGQVQMLNSNKRANSHIKLAQSTGNKLDDKNMNLGGVAGIGFSGPGGLSSGGIFGQYNTFGSTSGVLGAANPSNHYTLGAHNLSDN